MAMNITRRDLLKLAGGSALGLLFTPVPWKVLDDLAIWTQKGAWEPPHGEHSTRFSVCTLCPAGCAVRARCVGAQPVSLAGVTAHPQSHGALCPMGLAGHHLAYHPLRAAQPLRLESKNGNIQLVPLAIDEAAAGIANVLAEMAAAHHGYVAVLDERPGRTISRLYQHFLAQFPRAAYLTSPGREDATLAALQELFETPCGPLGVDVENTATLLSFGAPICDGWDTPGRISHLRRPQLQQSNGARLQIIQIETRQSRTALQSSSWLPVKPGSEAALAMGLAHVIVREQLCDRHSLQRQSRDFQCGGGRSYCDLVAAFPPERAAKLTGIAVDSIISTARQVAQGGPAVAIGGADPGGGPLGAATEIAIAGLNLLLGNVGKKGGIVPRREVPFGDIASNCATMPATAIADMPDHSIRVLIIDAAESGYAMPWPLLERKLVPERALVISLSPFRSGWARHADYLIPAPAPFESLQEATTPSAAPLASFSISVPLLAPPASAVEPVELLNRLAAGLGMNWAGMAHADLIKNRVAALQRTGRGQVFIFEQKQWQDMSAIGSGEQLWELFAQGACWQDQESAPAPLPRFSMLGKGENNYEWLLAAAEGNASVRAQTPAASSLLLMPFGWRGAVGNGQISPLLSKIYQESELREAANQAFINPDTARAHGIAEEGPARLQTSTGVMRVRLHFDAAVQPGVVQVAVAPLPNGAAGVNGTEENVLALCALQEDGSWRVTPAKVARV